MVVNRDQHLGRPFDPDQPVVGELEHRVSSTDGVDLVQEFPANLADAVREGRLDANLPQMQDLAAV
jgi:hypothetical protein